jgi:class 3 adenylate cyclase
MAIDVVAYSTHMERDELGTYARFKVHRDDVIMPEVARFRGRIFKFVGDGILVEFGNSFDAIECAIAIQRRTATHNSTLYPDQCLELRIGIDLGEVIVEGEDLFGEEVNTAVRLEQLAKPGGISLSKAVYDEVEQRLSLHIEQMGAEKLKNIAEPVMVFRINP